MTEPLPAELPTPHTDFTGAAKRVATTLFASALGSYFAPGAGPEQAAGAAGVATCISAMMLTVQEATDARSAHTPERTTNPLVFALEAIFRNRSYIFASAVGGALLNLGPAVAGYHTAGHDMHLAADPLIRGALTAVNDAFIRYVQPILYSVTHLPTPEHPAPIELPDIGVLLKKHPWIQAAAGMTGAFLLGRATAGGRAEKR